MRSQNYTIKVDETLIRREVVCETTLRRRD